jgi:hypothetical protein
MKYTFILHKIIPVNVEEQLCITLVSNMFFKSKQPVNELKCPEWYICTSASLHPVHTVDDISTDKTSYGLGDRGFGERGFGERTSHVCYWDHHPFHHDPFRIPIQPLHPRSNYTITKSNTYTIPVYLSSIDGTKPIIFISDGYFCSLSCALAYVLDHPHEPMYHESVPLLHYIASKYFNIERLHPAIPWTRLEQYGGSTNINMFRSQVCPTLVDASCYDMPMYMCMQHNMFKI